MKQSYQLSINYNIDHVLEMAECHKENSNYESYKDMLIELIEHHISDIEPKGYYITDQCEDKKFVYCIVTIGPKIDEIISSYFADYGYLEGMLMSSLGDDILFEATNQLYEFIKSDASQEQLFLSTRYEPGTTDDLMTMQKVIYDKVVPTFNLEMTITEGFMLSPSKSLAYYYQLLEDDCSLGIDHDCSACDSLKCKQRKYIIQVNKQDSTSLIQGRKGENLLEVLRRQGIYVEAPCNGAGRCGKCKVKVFNSKFTLSEKELNVLSENEQKDGYILSCLHQIDHDISLYIGEEASHFEIESDYKAFQVKSSKYGIEDQEEGCFPLGIGVDIGTTTLAVSLINQVTHETIASKKSLNPQKAYGSDIITRIMYVRDHKDHILSQLIRTSLEEMILELLKENTCEIGCLKEMVISGNTTMIYLLLNIDPSVLAIAPFTTIDMGLKELDSKEIFRSIDGVHITIIPWISAYVGGDIVSGLYGNHLMDEARNILFVDIGTNGEMVIKTKDCFIGASTAAGPAFEGANIKCGMGSVSGAICRIEELDDSYHVETLGNLKPIGICGSALIDAVALMRKQGYIDDMGYMEKEVMIHGDIGIYPEDIRQVQLAKAAIYAGIEVLLDVANITIDDIDVFYIAGGFGSHLNVENSAFIGLIPESVVDKVIVVGNASLAGSMRYLLENNGREEIEKLLTQVRYEELSMSSKFNERYVEAMMFNEKE